MARSLSFIFVVISGALLGICLRSEASEHLNVIAPMLLANQAQEPPETVCYDDLGCFDAGAGSENFLLHSNLPQSPEEISPSFRLYTSPANGPLPDFATYQSIDYFNLSTSVSSIRRSVTVGELFVLVHGFLENEQKAKWMFPIAQNVMQQKRANVILVYWTKGSRTPNYFKAAADTRVVGAMMAKVIREFVNQSIAELDKTTIMGFSLGAHIAGFAGERLPGLFRIVGMDPAGPLFGGAGGPVADKAKLDPSDASLVIALHTNTGSILNGHFGLAPPAGHYDFYANGGSDQPGCKLFPAFVNLLNVEQQSGNAGENPLACSHHRAAWLMLQAIQQKSMPQGHCRFYGTPCSSSALYTDGRCFPKCLSNSEDGCPYLAMDVDDLTSRGLEKGSYYFSTRGDNETLMDFCGSEFQIKLTSDRNIRGELSLGLTDDHGRTEIFQLQGRWGTLKANQQKSFTVVTAWGYVPRFAYVSYEPFGIPFLLPSTKSFQLLDGRITDIYGMTYLFLDNKRRTITTRTGETFTLGQLRLINSQ